MLSRDSLTNSQRTVLHKLYFVEADRVQDERRIMLPRIERTDEAKKRYKQLRGFSMAADTADGGLVDYEDPLPMHLVEIEPLTVTKGVQCTPQMKFTDQFGLVAGFMAQFAKAHAHKRNQLAANLYNLGFTATDMGANSEALFSASHDMAGQTFSNLLTGPFSPNVAKALLIAAGNQISAVGEPQPYTGKLLVMTPPDGTPNAIEVIKSLQIANSANNNTNEFLRNRLEHEEIHYFTSTTAFFARAMDARELGVVFVEQMPFDIVNLPRDSGTLKWPWASIESNGVGWFDAHNVFGSTGL